MNFDFLNQNQFDSIVFKKNVFFKTKPFLHNLKLDNLSYFLTDRYIQHQIILQNPSNWTVDKENKTAFFKKELIKDVEFSYLVFMKKNLDEQINILINNEFLDLIPEKSGMTWQLIEVPLSDLLLPVFYSKEKFIVDIYEDYMTHLKNGGELIGGIFLPNGEKFKLIDGYHRLKTIKDYYSDETIIPIVALC